MITAAQCRSARTLLGWSVGKLASTASISESAVDDFELEHQPPDAATANAIQRALEGFQAGFYHISRAGRVALSKSVAPEGLTRTYPSSQTSSD
jgi:transcriptional regulator with XRE-family HTH domain